MAGALGIALSIITIILALAGIYAVWFLMVSVRDLMVVVEDLRSRLVPLLEKADVTVDAINAELLRLDAIVTQAEEVGDVVSTASGFIRAPVNSAAQGLARLARAFGRK